MSVAFNTNSCEDASFNLVIKDDQGKLYQKKY